MSRCCRVRAWVKAAVCVCVCVRAGSLSARQAARGPLCRTNPRPARGNTRARTRRYTPKGGGKPYTVAVKRLKMELFRNQEDLDLFVQEVELMRKLSHRWE